MIGGHVQRADFRRVTETAIGDDAGNAAFYRPDGLRRLTAHLKPGGVFGLWSNEQPDAAFTDRLAGVFADARAELVTFHNPLQNNEFTQTVYLARTPAGG